jgi:D-serine deaminase-like pyridoxal phosphate-dependent protein
MEITTLPTPGLLLDHPKLVRNIRRMQERMGELGVALRPHVKTAKSLDVARLLFDGEAGPITVSTLREAEYFADGGFRDILYAVSIVPDKLERVRALNATGAEVTLVLDDPGIAAAVSETGSRMGVRFRTLVEIDSDGHRAGLTPDDADVMGVARILHEGPGTAFAGFMTHAGGSYDSGSVEAIKAAARAERDAVVASAGRVVAAGLPCPIVSVGSTPTATFADDLTGVTEVRAGVFVFQDLFQAGLGVCGLDDLALSVLTTVVGHKRDQRRLITDAGALALSKDRSTASQARDQGYGLVCDALSGAVIDELVVAGVNQEHGIIVSRGPALDLDRYPIGTKLRILPNHACMTAAAYDAYSVVAGGRVTARWERCNGW